MAVQTMGTGVGTPRRPAGGNWRAVMRRSLRRASEMGAALLLWGAMLFLAISLITYHQTDASSSTAAGGETLNWMGGAGAWTADFVLMLFGLVAALLLPLLHVAARKLWRLAGDIEDEAPTHPWWNSLLVLLVAMVLLATALSLVWPDTGDSFPASIGGLAGIMGEKAIRGLASLLPAGQGWAIFALGLLTLVGGAILAGRVFAIDWAGLFTLPRSLPQMPRLSANEGEALVRPRKEAKAERVAAQEAIANAPQRRAPEISDPSRPVKPAQLTARSKQGDLFDSYELPGLELLADPAPSTAPKRSESVV